MYWYGGYGSWDEYVESSTTTTETTENAGPDNSHLLQMIGALLEADFNVRLYDMQMRMDELQVRAEQGDKVAQAIDVNAYRVATDEQKNLIKRILGRR